MEGKRKKKIKDIAVEHMATGIKIRSNNICASCPYKVFVNEDNPNVTLGTGNINSNFIFVLPTYDTRAGIHYSTLLTVLSQTFNEVTCKNIFEEAYITRLVKCSSRNEHNIYNSAIAPCSSYFSYELNKLPAKHIVFFGSTYDDYNNNKGTVALYLHDKIVYKVYSPAVLYYDNDNFKDKLFKDLTSILSQ